MRQPRHHQSTSIRCPIFLMISGARYSGVPQMEVADSSEPSILESPKSVSLIYPTLSMMIFSGFKLDRENITLDR